MEERDQLEVIRDTLYEAMMNEEAGSEKYKAICEEYLKVSKHIEEIETERRKRSAEDDRVLLEERASRQQQEAFEEQKKSTRVGWALTLFGALIGPICYNGWLNKSIKFDMEGIAHFPSVRNVMNKIPMPKIFK